MSDFQLSDLFCCTEILEEITIHSFQYITIKYTFTVNNRLGILSRPHLSVPPFNNKAIDHKEKRI